MENDIIKFTRAKDFELIKELGQGACGKTVLLYDPLIEERFVCKKFQPSNEEEKILLFNKFRQEIKLLHQIYHTNIVRVFNYFLYPDQCAGFILMEHIDGDDFEAYLSENPERINEIFIQVIDGFSHLEKNKILHRDIRRSNIMITFDGNVKIIDFGFSKKITEITDYYKSTSVNSWCEPPNEFDSALYDFTTEIYFIGKLFQQIIIENNIESFVYNKLLLQMCNKDDATRIQSFFDIEKSINSNMFLEIDFNENEKLSYRFFADSLLCCISRIEKGAKYYDDIPQILKKLEDAYRKMILEEYVPYSPHIVRCFVDGRYYFERNSKFPVNQIKSFLHLLKTSSLEKQKIFIANLQTRLDSIKRYDEPIVDNEIPF